jgi:hypothetical protein
MGFGALRDLAVDLNFDFAHGVPVTVTRPAPDDDPIETHGIWIVPITESAPLGGFGRQEPRRILALRRDQVPTVPKGTVIVGPPKADADPVGWRVDGIDRIEADHVRVIVVEDPTANPEEA